MGEAAKPIVDILDRVVVMTLLIVGYVMDVTITTHCPGCAACLRYLLFLEASYIINHDKLAGVILLTGRLANGKPVPWPHGAQY
jgi:hypothetical protein